VQLGSWCRIAWVEVLGRSCINLGWRSARSTYGAATFDPFDSSDSSDSFDSL
jgi:hypothetical protein